MHTINETNNEKNNKSDNEKIDDVLEEIAIGNDCCVGGTEEIRNSNAELCEIYPTDGKTDNWH